MPITLTRVRRYPVKSCRGEDLDTAIVEPWGLRGDRRWMVIDRDAVAVTAREVHRMLLARPGLVEPFDVPAGGGLTLSAPDLPGIPDLFVPTPRGGVPDPSAAADPADPAGVAHPASADTDPGDLVQIWKSTVAAAPGGPEADAWFSEVLQQQVRLVYLDDPTRRATNPEFSRPDDRVTFADAYPVLLASANSLDVLNDWIAEGPRPDEGPLDIRRFRPNLVVRGAAPFAEDGWTRIRIGDATFRVVKGCDRCVLTTLDPDTGDKQMEPITTLARYRRWDGKTWFAANLVPDTPGAVLRVGDEVEVLEERDGSDGPIRPAA
ncbi:MAG TPA: MOSC domain-containing protein [Pseudolysinimonas sp.]